MSGNTGTAISSKWTQYTITHRHEKRAELVCETCHSKKIKCDLQGRRRNGINDCSFCSRSGRDCQPRVPKRRPRRGPTTGGSSHKASNSTDVGADASTGSTASEILPITPRSHDEAAKFSAGSENESFAMMRPDQSYGSGQATARNRSWSSASHSRPEPTVLQLPQDGFQAEPTAQSNEGRQVVRSTESIEAHKGDVDTGFLQVYGRENLEDAQSQALRAFPRRSSANPDLQVSEELLNIFADTYFDDCYAWCPVLDRETLHHDLARSPLLQNSLAVLGSHVRPPILPHEGPGVHYDRARRMFYEDEEPDNLTCLRGILLFNWYAPRSTAMVHRHSSWWWTSIVIRHAQQMAMHRAADQPEFNTPSNRIGRRVWWTAFARERLTALCQSKPPIIDPNDCSVPEPSLDDFPPESRDDTKPVIFIHWVRLCAIVGRVAHMLSHPTAANPSNVADQLKGWVASLPIQVRISLATRYVSNFDKDAYQLHIPYLIAIIVLHLRRIREPGALPLALPPAIFAASCLARIFKGILAKGDTRFLMPITSWYCGVSYITLLAASKDPMLKEAVQADMEIIVLMCDQLRKMWASANVIYLGFERLRAMAENDSRGQSALSSARGSVAPQGNDLAMQRPDETLPGSTSLDWIDYFPFAANETSRTVEVLLDLRQKDTYSTENIAWDPSLLDIRDWSDGLLGYTDFSFENEFLDSWVG
ncbi:hypothetical protein PRZ48_007813 [Zasmidium cellare]|uniref:Zn(2)-C6 fungal-type domain-containing protein n=1 Tax=Zasmidium cellare TaxID=395010 RepID=A0ABR0EKJ3_ZASCE|nr:hypothetical protein PRZ48_007813 [Zasmidium cellare]